MTGPLQISATTVHQDNPLESLTVADAKRFWSKVQIDTADACWPWQSEILRNGYGRFLTHNRGPRRHLAHRVACRLANGSFPAQLLVLHSCDNRPCCNPAHLRPGTQKENIADAMAKGRKKNPPVNRGERGSSCVLTEEQVREIHRLYAAGSTRGQLGAQFGVAPTTIGGIVRGDTWAQLGLPRITRKRHPFLEVVGKLGYPEAPQVADAVNRWNADGQQGWFTDDRYQGGGEDRA